MISHRPISKPFKPKFYSFITNEIYPDKRTLNLAEKRVLKNYFKKN